MTPALRELARRLGNPIGTVLASADDADVLELLATHEAALEAAGCTLVMSRQLASGRLVLARDAARDAYLARVDRDAQQLEALRAYVAQAKTWFRVH
jgi:hypothetical protein